MSSPLEQFKIKPYIRINNEIIDITISNNTIYIIMTIILILITVRGGINKRIIPTRISIITREIYKGVERIIGEMIPGGESKRYIPVIISIMLFIGGSNIIGLVPYSYTTTSQIIITITMSITIIIGLTIIGARKHGIGFIQLFIPKGLEGMKYIIPLIFIIELVSYIIRIISLSVRLTANILSGHTLLKIVSNFTLTGISAISYYGVIIGVLPVILIGGIYILEIGVAIIQTYVFTLLTITYLKDAILLH